MREQEHILIRVARASEVAFLEDLLFAISAALG
jgi:hypothetical protein